MQEEAPQTLEELQALFPRFRLDVLAALLRKNNAVYPQEKRPTEHNESFLCMLGYMQRMTGSTLTSTFREK